MKKRVTTGSPSFGVKAMMAGQQLLVKQNVKKKDFVLMRS